MKKLMIIFLFLGVMFKGYSESQVVYFPVDMELSEEVKIFINESVKHFCSEGILRSQEIILKSFEIISEESASGAYLTTVKALLEVKYKHKTLSSDEIELVVNNIETFINPQFPSLSLKGLHSTGGVCRD